MKLQQRSSLEQPLAWEGSQEGQTDGPEPDDHYLPPRKTVHPTEKERWLHFFYRSLLWIFILLVAGLLAWGYYRYMKGIS